MWRYSTGLIALAVLVIGAPAVQGQTKARSGATLADLSGSLETTAQLVGPTVVEIFSISYAPGEAVVAGPAALVTKQRASGSGVIVHPDGFIVTNAHVVRGAQRLMVEFPAPAAGRSILGRRSRALNARVVGIDLETDLAVVHVDQTNLPHVTFGDSDELKTGQLVLAVGSPLGLHNSVSLGVISAVARQLEPESPMIYVQTDAALNPGSSGGALVDLRGRLIGINTRIVSQAGGDEGLGFAAPSNIVRTVYEQIRTLGKVRRGDIGIRAQTVTPELASGLSLPRDHGAILSDVIPGSPAAHMGLRIGDIVLALDGKPIENGRQLHVNLYRRFVGDIVSIEVLRDGRTMKVPVAVAEREEGIAALAASIDPRQNLVAKLSILGIDLDPRLAEILPVRRVASGVVVASTVADALDAREGGLSPGDVIYAVNGKAVGRLPHLRDQLDRSRPGDAVVLQIERRGELMFLPFTID